MKKLQVTHIKDKASPNNFSSLIYFHEILQIELHPPARLVIDWNGHPEHCLDTEKTEIKIESSDIALRPL